MYRVELHKRITQAIDLFYRIGLWHQGDVATVRETRLKIFYSIYHILFPISLIAGAIELGNSDESIFLGETGIITFVLSVKFSHIIWKQEEIVELLHRIGVYSIKDEEDFNSVDRKNKLFMKLTTFFFFYAAFIAVCINIIAPIVENERILFFKVGFPLDYKTSEISYWIAFAFVATECVLTVISLLFSVLMWFLLLHCGLKYKVLGSELRNMGVTKSVDDTGKKLKEMAAQKLFSQDLIAGMDSYADINESTQQVESFLSNMMALQLSTSALCICASIYILAYMNVEHLVEMIIYTFYTSYNIFDIFMVLYGGNEIKLLSDRLSYCLFESNWMDQPQSCKTSIIIFGERLKQAQELVILKLYPVTLETFTRILNSAYNMFNILKNMA